MWNSCPVLFIKLAILTISPTLNVTYFRLLAYSTEALNLGVQMCNIFSQLDTGIDWRLILKWYKGNGGGGGYVVVQLTEALC
jgi:hypothetical protein